MQKLKQIICKSPIISTFLIVLVILLFQFQTHISISSNDLVNGIIKEAIFALITLFFVYVIAGKSEVIFSTTGLDFALKKSWWLLTIPFVLGVGLTIITLSTGHPISGNPFFILIIAFLDAFATGIYEESIMRGLIFNSLLSKEGGSYKGIFSAMVLSSLIFGFIHVAPDFFSSFPNIPINDLSQMIGKTLQSGMLGFLLAAIYLRNHNLWNIALIHGLNDFFLMVPTYLLNSSGTGNYVQSSGATSNGIVYYVQAVLSIPFIITAIRIVRNTKLPQYGFFKESWKPEAVNNKKK